jgi:hypothetical protein
MDELESLGREFRPTTDVTKPAPPLSDSGFA